MPVLEEEADDRIGNPAEIKGPLPGGGFGQAVIVLLGQVAESGCSDNAPV